MADTALLERTEIDPTTGEPRCSHIVAPTLDKTAMERVMESRIYGTPVDCLCGHVMVVQRDPKQFPLCSRCKAIREDARPDQNPEDIPS